ncbi:hypothetical protein ACMA1I_14095 [Pontibacter sp. 13R65]|uniref:hypothetical protein n=1 Tax=Pontibacter sp. 13R65 TaxID=3127458 RepID=UPI00301BFB97
MLRTLTATINKFERQVDAGQLTSFSIQLSSNGVIIYTSSRESTELVQVPLIEEMQQSLKAYFYGEATIDYGSIEYNTLQSFINASFSVEPL